MYTKGRFVFYMCFYGKVLVYGMSGLSGFQVLEMMLEIAKCFRICMMNIYYVTCWLYKS